MSGLLASWRKLSRRKQWLRTVRDRHPDDRVFVAVIASVFVIAVGGALSVLILGVWVVNSIQEPARAETVNIFRPPSLPEPKPRPKPKPQPKPLAILQHARYLHFQDPRFTAKFMADYLNGGPAFDDVVYGVAIPSEITLHGNLHGSHFDLRLYKLGRQRVLLRNCMMGSCYSEWTGRFVGREPAQRSGRFHERSLLRQQVRAGVLRLWSQSSD